MRRDFVRDPNGDEVMITTAEFADGWATIIEDMTGGRGSRAFHWPNEETALRNHDRGVCRIVGCPESHPPNEHIDLLVKLQRAKSN